MAEALRLLAAHGGLVDDAGAQVDLFEGFEADDGVLPLPLPAKGASGPKGGRPRGARNRSTEEWVRFFLSQHKAPLTVAANVYGQRTDELHAALQAMADKHTRTKTHQDGTVEEVRVLVDPLAVLKLQLQAAQGVAPYIHKQQPKAIEIEARQRGIVLLGDLADTAEDVGSDDVALPLPPLEQKQGVVGAARAGSDDATAEQSRQGPEINDLEVREG